MLVFDCWCSAAGALLVCNAAFRSAERFYDNDHLKRSQRWNTVGVKLTNTQLPRSGATFLKLEEDLQKDLQEDLQAELT